MIWILHYILNNKADQLLIHLVKSATNKEVQVEINQKLRDQQVLIKYNQAPNIDMKFSIKYMVSIITRVTIITQALQNLTSQ
jgi:hypothetical protein